MNDVYARAYTEVLEIIKTLPEEEISRIDQKKLDFYQNHKDNNYTFYYNSSLSLKEQGVSRKAEIILVNLFRDYFATENQREKLDNILKLNWMKKQEKLKEKYDPNSLFVNENTPNQDVTNCKKTNLIEHKPNIFIRLCNRIKQIFMK